MVFGPWRPGGCRNDAALGDAHRTSHGAGIRSAARRRRRARFRKLRPTVEGGDLSGRHGVVVHPFLSSCFASAACWGKLSRSRARDRAVG